MPVGPLRKAAQDWAHETFIEPDPNSWWGRVQKRWGEYWASWNKYYAANPGTAHLNFWAQWTNAILYALTGAGGIKASVDDLASGKQQKDVSHQIVDEIDKLFSTKVPNEVVESIGAVITEPVLALFEKYAGRDDLDPKAFARAFHGFMISLNLSSGIASTVIEAASAGAIKGAGKMVDQMYWSLGLGFLGWQTLAPLLTSGLQPGLNRYYKRLYRPQRFAASDLRDLYALGQVDKNAVYEEGRNEGWRDQDLDQWIKLAFRTLAQGDIWDAYHKGFIDQDEAVKRLRILGYDPDDIPLLFKLNPAPEVSDGHAFSVATARTAYKDQLLSKSQLTTILKGLRYTDLEINTLIAVDDLAIASNVKSLSIGQIKSAWADNVVNDTEARHYMSTEGLDSSQQDILLKTWQAEVAPKARQINSGTIGAAYLSGILTRAQAATRLQDIGYSQDDALLQLDLVEKRNPEAFGAPPPAKVKTLAPGTLAGLLAVGLITADQMNTRLVALGYAQADADLLTQAAVIQTQAAVRKLPQASIENAYVAGVLTRAQANQYLLDLGFDAASAKVILDADEASNKGVFKQGPAARSLTLTAGTLSDLLILGIITPDVMKTDLVALGYGASDADLLVARSQSLATPLPRVLTADNIRQAYLYGVITRDQANQKLLDLDYSQADADTLLDTLEAAYPQVFHPDLVQSVRAPSISALATAVYNGIITEQEFYARAQEIGYAPEDAKLYLRPVVNGAAKPTVTLSASQILAAYDAGLFDYATALTRLEALGYNEADTIILIRTRKDQIKNGDAWFSLMNGSISPDNAIAQLIAAGYSDNDIYNAFASLAPSVLAAMGINLAELKAALALTPGGE